MIRLPTRSTLTHTLFPYTTCFRSTAQHRMHPAIASIISTCFYDELTTDPARDREFRSDPSPVSSIDVSRLPDAPVVWVDMPYLQNTIGMKDRKSTRLNSSH